MVDSKVWRVENGIALWSYASAPGVDRTAPDVLHELGLRVSGLPTRGTPRTIGTVELTSGCLPLLVPFEAGCSAEQVRSVIASGQPLHLDNAHMLIPLPPGRYDIVDEPLAATTGARVRGPARPLPESAPDHETRGNVGTWLVATPARR